MFPKSHWRRRRLKWSITHTKLLQAVMMAVITEPRWAFFFPSGDIAGVFVHHPETYCEDVSAPVVMLGFGFQFPRRNTAVTTAEMSVMRMAVALVQALVGLDPYLTYEGGSCNGAIASQRYGFQVGRPPAYYRGLSTSSTRCLCCLTGREDNRLRERREVRKAWFLSKNTALAEDKPLGHYETKFSFAKVCDFAFAVLGTQVWAILNYTTQKISDIFCQ